MWKAILVSVVLVIGGVQPSQAQAYIEAGANIGHACLTGEASCEDQVVARGWQAGIWMNEKIAIRVRYLDAPRPDNLRRFGEYTVRWSDYSRSLWLGEVTWHFGAPSLARIYAGLSIGARKDRVTITCEPVDCDRIPPTTVSVGTGRPTAHPSLGGVAGVSIHPMRRLVIMAQVGAHDYPGEHAGTLVFSAHAVYRHPISR